MPPTTHPVPCTALLAVVEALGPLGLAAIGAALVILGASSDGGAILPGGADLPTCLSCLR